MQGKSSLLFWTGLGLVLFTLLLTFANGLGISSTDGIYQFGIIGFGMSVVLVLFAAFIPNRTYRTPATLIHTYIATVVTFTVAFGVLAFAFYILVEWHVDRYYAAALLGVLLFMLAFAAYKLLHFEGKE